MDVIIMPTAAKAAELAARIIADAVKAKPAYTLGLATGRTMERLYAYLADWHKTEGLDFSLCKSFNLDEYVGFDGSNKDSYRFYMNHHLFDKINIDKRNTYGPNGVADDLDAAAAEYEAEMDACGGVDLQLLGIGRTGHIGFNEPLSSFASRTRAVTLTKTTFEQNSPLFDKPEDMPMRAVTMGVGTILEAKKLLLVATGDEKASIVAKTVEGPLTSMISATALQLHEDAVVILDEAAAAQLSDAEGYKWSFAHDPRWAAYQNI